MKETRFPNRNWELPSTSHGGIETWQHVEIAVLMDIRDELQRLNRLLHCHNTLQIPQTLLRIDRRLSKTRTLTKAKKATKG